MPGHASVNASGTVVTGMLFDRRRVPLPRGVQYEERVGFAGRWLSSLLSFITGDKACAGHERWCVQL